MKTAKSVEWEVDGMSCVNCALSIEKYLKSNGLQDAKVDFASKSVRFNSIENTDLQSLKSGINQLGFEVLNPDIKSNKWTQDKVLLTKIIICSVFTLPLILSMFLPFAILKNPLTQLILSTPVTIIGFVHFGKKAFYALKSGILNMDVLIILGGGAAFIYSLIGYLQNLGEEYLFFETAATIFTIILIGNFIEQWSLQKTTDAISALVNLQVPNARKVTNFETNEWEEIPVSAVKLNDKLLVQNGDTVPVDGQIIKGSGLMNEAFLTGESELILKNEGDFVFAGSLAMEAPFTIKTTQIGENTSLQKIISLVKKAQSEKPDIQKLADKISAVFIPLVIGIAIFCFALNFYFWNETLQNSVMRTIAVLVVACPCAMGLATPTAVIVGVGRLSKIGLLINNGQLIEELAKVKQIVFDKTGTLTSGKFNITNAYSNIDISTFKGILKGLEVNSSHPLAKSIANILKTEKAIKLSEVNEVKGIGVFGKDDLGNTYAIGSYNLAKDITKDDSHNIYVLKNNQLIGWLDLADELKTEVKTAITALQKSGFELFLLSGDKSEKTAAIAKEIGIEKYYAEKLPAEKLAILEQIMTNGKTMMVGDGINDAPALVKADIGISLGDASDVAIHSADGILVNKDFNKLSEAVKISKATSACIKQNLFWAFFYNILMIPLAIVGLLHPMFAALAMALSDIFVIGNAIRLKYKKID